MRLVLVLLVLAGPAAADTVVAARTVRAQAILTAADLTVVDGQTPGAFRRPAEAIGQEARVVLYAGRPVRTDAVGPPALVERNQIVPLLFRRGGLSIVTEGRALGRAGAGDRLRVMNLGSRNIVTGTVGADGRIRVGPHGPAEGGQR